MITLDEINKKLAPFGTRAYTSATLDELPDKYDVDPYPNGRAEWEANLFPGERERIEEYIKQQKEQRRAKRMAEKEVNPSKPGRLSQEQADAITASAPATRKRRELKLISMANVKPRALRWLWKGYVPLGALTLIVGREGIGKSSVAYQVAADITRGTLQGHMHGAPKSVVIVATEDAWEYTIVPRLMAAGADMNRIYSVGPSDDYDPYSDAVSLPVDIPSMAELLASDDIPLLLLDPIMSRVGDGIDTNNDKSFRQALEPLVRMADETKTAVIGLTHFNKDRGADPLTRVMGGRALAAVSRSVIAVAEDPDDDELRLMQQVKNNLAAKADKTLAFRIVEAIPCTDDSGEEIKVGRVEWQGESETSVKDALYQTENTGVHTASGEAEAWLKDYMEENKGTAPRTDIMRDANEAGHSKNAIEKARTALEIQTYPIPGAMPRKTMWELVMVVDEGGDLLD